MLYLIYTLILAGAGYFYLRNKPSKLYIPFVLGIVLKISAGTALGLLYKHYYGVLGDTFYYHTESIKITNLLMDDFGRGIKLIVSGSEVPNPRSLFFIKLVSILNIFTLSNYWINAAICSLFSFFGVWALSLYLFEKDNVPILLTLSSVLIFPSNLLWSSGLLKESLVFGSLCFLLKLVYKFSQHFKLKPAEYVITVFMVILLLNLRYFYAAVFIPIAFSYIFTKWVSKFWLNRSEKFVFSSVAISTLCIVTLLHPNLSHDYIATVLLQNYHDVKRISALGDSYDLWVGETLLEDWRVVPQAIFTGLFRPLPWDVSVGLKTLVGSESVLILIISTMGVYITVSGRKITLEFFSILIYVILLSFAMAVASPNWGSLLRYRIGYQPFFLMLVFIVIANSNVVSTLKKRKIPQ